MNSGSNRAIRPPVPPAGGTLAPGAYRQPVGKALHAVKVIVGAAFEVLLLGEFSETTRHRHR